LNSDAPGEVGKALDTGTGGATGDAALDVPLGGAGGSGPDGAIDTSTADTGGQGGGGRGGKGTGGSGTAGSGTGGSGTGGSGTGGSGTGGSGTGGSGTGGSGTGGSGTGGSGTGGATVSTSGLVIYYACDETSGSTLTDNSVNGRNATLVTGTGGTAGYSFGTGKVNNALHLVKASQGYADIGANTGPFSATMTVATWVYLNSSVSWQRVWDFGIDINTYMFLTPKNIASTPVIHFGISTGSYGSEQGIDGTAELPIKEWHHVAVVLSSGTGYLYVDGIQVGTKPSMTLTPAGLGITTKNWIGKSQFYATATPDPYLDGNIDEFRVYSRALTPAEISILAGK
jgi:hypothetical protein